jgi:hypothetical protein
MPTPAGPPQGYAPAKNAVDPQVTIIGLAERKQPTNRMSRPHHEQHVVTKEQLPPISLPVGDDGVVIGADVNGQPSVLGLFRRRPMEVVLVGGAYVTQLIVLRAAAVGARVVVETARPKVWAGVAQNAGGGQQCVTVAPVGRLGALGASLQSPVLVVRDAGARPPRARMTKTAYQSTLTLLPYLDQRALGLLSSADLVAIQRVSPQEAVVLGRTLRLPAEDVESLPSIPDDLTVWCSRQERQYVFTRPTTVEVGLLGNPRRMDS